MKIVGFCGKMGAGKDTAAQFAIEWCRRQGLNAERMAFADPLKRSAAAALGYEQNGPEEPTPVDICNRLKQSDVKIVVYTGYGSERYAELTGREYLQRYGTEAHRDVFGPNFWVDVTERKLAEMSGAVDVVFLTDPRFGSEAKMIRHHEGEIWEVVRPDLESTDTHSSEAGLPDGAIEFQIINAGDLTDLQNLVESVCESNLR